MTADCSKWPSHVHLYDVKRNLAAKEANFWDCCCNMGHFLCGAERYSVMWTPICIVPSAVCNGQAKCQLCRSMEKFLWTPMPMLFMYNVTSALYCAINNHFCVIRVLCCNLSVRMSFNVRFTTNRVCMKTYTHIYVVWTSED